MRTVAEIENEIRILADRGRQLNRLHNDASEGYDHTDQAAIDALHAEREAALAAAEIGEWNAETTAARRAAWNAAATARPIRTPADLIARERELGYAMADLKKHIARHAANV